MSLVIYARNVTRINRKTGSIVQHAIVISRTRLASNFTLKYRPKAIQPVRRTIVAVCVPPQWTETNRDNCTCVVTNIATLAKCLCLKITWKRPRRKKQPGCWKKTKEKGRRGRWCAKMDLLWLWMHTRRDDSVQWRLQASPTNRMWKLQPIWLSYQSMSTRILTKEDDNVRKLS